MPGLLDLVAEETPELEIVPDGEYKLEIKKVINRDEDNPYDSGRQGWGIAFGIVDRPDAAGVFHNLTKPNADDPKTTYIALLERVKAFAAAFNLSSNDSTEWVGAQGWAKLTAEQYQGKDKNSIESFSAPK